MKSGKEKLQFRKGKNRMKAYQDMSREELLTLKAGLEEEYKTAEAKGLSLNMARGKPGASQLALSMPMLDVINSGEIGRASCRERVYVSV